MFIGTLTITLLISLSLGAFTVFSRKALLRQAEENNLVYAGLLGAQLEHTLEELRSYLHSIYYLDDRFEMLCNTDNTDSRYLLSREIMIGANNYVSLYPYGVLIYMIAENLKTPFVTSLPADADLIAVSDYFHNEFPQSEAVKNSDTGFHTLEINGTFFLSQNYERSGVSLGVLVDTSTLLSTVEYDESFGNTRISIIDPNGITVAESPVNIPDKKSLVSEAPLHDFPMAIRVTAPADAFLRKISVLQFLSVLLTVLSIVIFILYFLFQQWKIYRPLRELRKTLQRIGGGDLDTRLDPDNPTKELSEIYGTINTYIDHMTALRVQTYEERLNRQTIELQFLQLQLRPHFFLNALKSIYALAENQNYTEIQDYVLCLSNHFRFLLYDTTKKIELKKELMHTQNYMKMQRIGLHKPDISCSLQMNDVNENTLVPPLLLQTFLENSIKYAIVPDRPLLMEIRVQKMELGEGNSRLNFSFQDNGPGFSESILREMEENEEAFFRHHKGFGNLKRRLGLIYSEKSEIYVYNNPSGGASVDILIPADEGI